MPHHWRKQLFVAEYVAHPELSATQVAERCGFTGPHVKTRAYELMRNPEVKAAIEEKQKELLDKVELKAEDVIKDILATRQRCIEEGAGAWQTQGRLKCDELLGRYLRMWEESEPKTVEGELKALPAPVEIKPVEVPRPRVVEATQEEPEPAQDWVERLL
jgi:hypothetical protein